MTAADYPVSYPYGATTPPYSPTHIHRGDDRAAPLGTPVVVQNTKIGAVGSTGLSTGSHLHLQEWQGTPANTRKPQNSFRGGTVVQASFSSDFGNYVTIETPDGWRDSYCHLDRIDVKVGDVIGDDMPISDERKYRIIKGLTGREATLKEITDANLWNDTEFAIDTFWNNGGADRYANHSEAKVKEIIDTRDSFGRIADQRFKNEKLIADIVGVDNPDDANAIAAKVQELKDSSNGEAVDKLNKIKEIIG